MRTNRILFLRRILIISLLFLAFSSLGAATIFSDSFNDGSVSGSWSTVGSVSEHGGELDIHNPGDCNYDKATVDLGNRDGDITIDQDWRVDISGWYEVPRYRVIVDGSTVFSDRYPTGRDYSGSGSYSDTVTVDGNVKVRFLVDPSGACGNGDHYHTDLYLDNVDITYTADSDFSSTSNSAASAGAAWIEDSDLHWADGSTEYWITNHIQVEQSSGPIGAWWIEGSAMHWIGENGYERSYTGTDTGNNPSSASPGNVWIENGMIHYIDASGNERKT